MKEKVFIRCAELLDKWGIEVELGKEIGTVWTFIGDDQFLSMMKIIATLNKTFK